MMYDRGKLKSQWIILSQLAVQGKQINLVTSHYPSEVNLILLIPLKGGFAKNEQGYIPVN